MDKKELWFGKTETGGFKPLTWQGKFSIVVYVVLLILAFFIYSSQGLILLVVLFYTVVFFCVVAFKSDLLSDRQPPE